MQLRAGLIKGEAGSGEKQIWPKDPGEAAFVQVHKLCDKVPPGKISAVTLTVTDSRLYIRIVTEPLAPDFSSNIRPLVKWEHLPRA